MKHDLNNKNFERKAKRVYSVFACVALLLVATAVPALAADDPLTVVNNLSDFIFSLIRAIGLILLGFGILQVGLSLKSHDPSQRANGMLTVAAVSSLPLLRRSSPSSPAEKRGQGERHDTVHPVLPVGGDFEWEVETGS